VKRIFLIALFAMSSVLRLAAQDPSTEYWRGFNSYNSFQVGSFETVNEDNFNLIVHIPIVSYPQRGTLAELSIAVGDETTGWYVQSVTLPTGGNYLQWTPTSNSSMNGPYVYASTEYYYGTRTYEDPGLPTYRDSYIQGPTLSIHNLGEATSGLAVVIDASGFTGALGITDRNGITYQPAKFGVYAIPGTALDPTGNSITADPNSQGLIDSVGRHVPRLLSIGYNGSVQPGTYTLNYPGLNGGTYPVTYVFATYSVNTTFNSRGAREFSASETFMQSITLPNGTKWTFTYNNYGDISSITTPTGGSVTYTWTTQCYTDPAGTCARVLATHAINANDGTGTRTWTYGQVKPGGTNGTAYPGNTDPDGNITAYTTVLTPPGSCGHTQIATTKQYYQFTSSGQAQTLLKTVNTNYTYGTSPFRDNCPGPTNLLPQYTKTTWPNGQSTQVSQVTFAYDSGATFYDTNYPPGGSNSYPLVYGSVLQKQETDFGPGAPGSLLRNTVTQPEWQVNSSYLTHGMLARPASVNIYDSTSNTCKGQGNPCAQATYAYDETGNGSACTTLPCGNLTSEIHWLSTGGSPKTQYVYNSQGMKTKKCDPIDANCANPTMYTYDSSGMFLSEIQYPTTGSATHTEFFNYDLNTGQLNWHKDQNNQQASYTYDSMWRLKTVSYPDTGSETYTYNDTVSYPNSPSFTFTKKITSSINFADTGIVDGLGRPITSKTTVPTSTCSAGYSYVNTMYDNEGRKFSTSNPYCTTGDTTYGVTKTYYDMLNRPVVVVPSDGTPPSSAITCPTNGNDVCTSYVGNCTTVTDQANTSRTSCTDGLGRMTKVLEDPAHLNYETDYGYDALGNLTSVNQGGVPRSFVYDSLSRLVSASNPESGTVCYASYSGSACQNQGGYDANGNLLTKTDARGITITYGYDLLNRLTQKSYSGLTISYAYDAVNPPCTIPGSFNYGSYPKPHRTAMCDAAGNEAWNYDLMGRVLVDQRTTNNVTKSTTYSFNFDGSVASLSYPSSRTLTYTMNSAAQPTTVMDTAYGINYVVGPTSPTTCPNGQAASGAACYTPFGTLARTQNGSSIITTAFYNTRLQPCRVAVNASGSGMPTTCADSTHNGDAMDFSYNFNLGVADNGNLYKQTNNRPNASDRNINYTYDAFNRIYQAYTDGNLWGETSTTDRWGNMHAIGPYGSKPAGETLSQGVSSSTNRFTNVCSGTCYDLAGNMTNDGTNSYTYDAESHITTVDSNLNYYYDGDGRRVEKSSGKLYWYGVGTDPLDETDLSGSTTNASFSEYIFFGGKRIARRDSSGNIFFYFADHLGTTRIIVQSGQTSPCYDEDFYPYGGEVPHSSEVPAFLNTCSQNYKFNGKERDGTPLTETGLDNFGARYDASRFGRFISPDWSAEPEPVPFAKLVNPQSLNLYAYVLNNPVSLVDLGGHDDDVPFYWKANFMNLGLNPFTGQDPSLTQTQLDYQARRSTQVSVKTNRYAGVWDSGHNSGGVDIELLAKVKGSKYKHFNWRQIVTSSLLGSGKPFVDADPGEPPPYYYWNPQQQTDYENSAQEDGGSTYFEDSPRHPFSGTVVTWHAVLSLVGINGNGTYDTLKRFSYGFTIDATGDQGVHPEELKELP
jgi:RHS repeat-associated protein